MGSIAFEDLLRQAVDLLVAELEEELLLRLRLRLDEILGQNIPAITIVELGGNDGLRGLPVTEISKNLGEIITTLTAKGSQVLLVPMLLPPNYGRFYIEKFSNIYTELAAQYPVTLGRFILEGVATRPELMQADGIHPKAEAQPIMLDTIWSSLEPMLKKSMDAAVQ